MKNDNKFDADQWANAVGQTAGALMEVIRKQGRQNPCLSWIDMVMAAGVACRGVAAAAMAGDPDLDLDTARELMLKRLIDVLALPPELVRAVKADEGEEQQIVVIPTKNTKRH